MCVARALMMLADRLTNADQEISIPQHQLALMCGLSRQRVNVALNALRQIGLIRSGRRWGYVSVHVPSLRDYVASS
jgi:biotin operon repressor